MKNFSKILGLAILTASIVSTFSCSNDDDNEDTGHQNVFVANPTNLKGEIPSGDNIVLDGDYDLTGALIVGNGATLTIKKGTEIMASSTATTNGVIPYIVVAQGGKIFVEGTSTEPVVMTADNSAPGSWGGLVICGKAKINKGATAQAEVSGLTYGGNDDTDSSGSIKYLRLEYTGYLYSADKEFNAVSFFGVGSGTVVEYVQSYNGSDDAFEWFGGTVNAKYLVSINDDTSIAGDDIFDWTEGWTGNVEYLYGKRTNNGNRGIEADNNSNNQAATPISFPHINKITLVGNSAGSENQAIKLRVGTKVYLNDVVLSNWGTGIDVQSAPDLSASFVGGDIKLENVKFDNVITQSTANATSAYTTNASATGAGNGTAKPTWAQGWTVGF
ncbi:hypothetical protein [Flavobacterium terrae]|uniref:Multidrug transporter n=1 Tax=Flavobacterium terrae TaxID=415425 RepID=A0A1M6BCC6_9FLAO|nr:hypothetical protein [Flavobacterium terrae]SHI46337.1 hypothetical protein SAMN05444363_0669 [Flavobacterium terrae]